ncbi:DUF507 family protein [bacterium]|nr:MAG: DUF507 family protein [bacterium]
MRFSEDRISHMAHLVADAVWKDDLADFVSEEKALQEIKHAISSYFRVEDEADTAVRRKISSLSRGVPEGSREWDILYKKYFEEEISKKKGHL